MTAECQAEMKQEKMDAFAEKMLAVINGGSLGLMISIGHRTGLFDVMKEIGAGTSEEIAEQANLRERYVREWLGAMTTGRVVEYQPEFKTYYLPPEHAVFLSRMSPDNMAVTTQFFALLGQVEDKIVDCFRHGGGVHYCSFGRFHEVMAEESAQTVVAALQDHILPLVPNLMDDLQRGIDVLDIGCGSGKAMCRLAEMFPNSRFTGYDFEPAAIEAALAECDKRKLKNVRFKVQNVAEITDAECFDLITAFDAIHDQAEPARVLARIAAALRPTGTFLMQDIAASSYPEKNLEHPLGTLLYTISCMHCMTVSLAQDGAGLGTCWGEELACEMLFDAGFRKLDVQRLPHDIMNTYYVAKKI